MYGAAAIAGYALVRNWISSDQDPGINDLDATDNGPRTLTDNQLVLMCEALEAALLGGWIGEDEDAIGAVMDMLNTDADVIALVEQFGIRCEGVVVQRCGSLPQWFVIYLSDAERADINATLESKGITYRF